jgi:hypothetical protein
MSGFYREKELLLLIEFREGVWITGWYNSNNMVPASPPSKRIGWVPVSRLRRWVDGCEEEI